MRAIAPESSSKVKRHHIILAVMAYIAQSIHFHRLEFLSISQFSKPTSIYSTIFNIILHLLCSDKIHMNSRKFLVTIVGSRQFSSVLYLCIITNSSLTIKRPRISKSSKQFESNKRNQNKRFLFPSNFIRRQILMESC